MRRLGVTFSHDELRDLYAMWRYIGHLVGVDPQLYRAVHDDETAAELLAAIDARFGGVTPEARALTRAMLDALAKILSDKLPMSRRMAFVLLSEVTRTIQGDPLADELGVERTPLRPWMTLVQGFNRGRRWLQRAVPAARAATIRKTIDVYEQGLLEVPDTPFAQFARAPNAQGFPRSIEV